MWVYLCIFFLYGLQISMASWFLKKPVEKVPAPRLVSVDSDEPVSVVPVAVVESWLWKLRKSLSVPVPVAAVAPVAAVDVIEVAPAAPVVPVKPCFWKWKGCEKWKSSVPAPVPVITVLAPLHLNEVKCDKNSELILVSLTQSSLWNCIQSDLKISVSLPERVKPVSVAEAAAPVVAEVVPEAAAVAPVEAAEPPVKDARIYDLPVDVPAPSEQSTPESEAPPPAAE